VNQVKVYFAVKQSGKGGMGGYLDMNGAVSVNGNRAISTNPVFAQAACVLAKRAHPDWVVDIQSTMADSAFFGEPSANGVKKCQAIIDNQ
jgi:hypothetical protein